MEEKEGNLLPKVTVITQAYNEEAYLPRCIKSVLGQTFSDFDFLLIDNGSEDQTGEIMEAFAREDSRIRVIHNKTNQAYTYWLQHLKQLVWGEYFVSLDADDWIEPSFLSVCIQIMEEKQVDVVCTAWKQVKPDGSTKEVMPFPKGSGGIHRFADFGRYIEIFTCIEHAWAKMYRTNVMLQMDLSWVDKRYNLGGDGIFWWMFLSKCKSIYLLPECMFSYWLKRDISARGYHMTDPNAFYGISTVLEQEYLLLNELQEPKKQHLRVLFQEYLLKASGFLEADLLEEFSFSERLERIAGLYTEDFHSIRKALLEEIYPQILSIQEETEILSAKEGESRRVKWLREIGEKSTAMQAVLFSLQIIQYLLHTHRNLCDSKRGLEETIYNLECDRDQKDQALKERDVIIGELIRVQDEKDLALKERDAIIGELIRVRDEKDLALKERETVIEELIKLGMERKKG